MTKQELIDFLEWVERADILAWEPEKIADDYFEWLDKDYSMEIEEDNGPDN